MENPWASKTVNPWIEKMKGQEPEMAPPSSDNPWSNAYKNPWLSQQVQAPTQSTDAGPDVGGSTFDTVLSRLIQAESRGKHRDASGKLTESPVGALGITQVMPATAAKPGFGVAPLQNDSEGEYVRFGKDYLTAMLKLFNNDYHKALAAYNAGAGSVQRALGKARLAGDEADWKNFLPKKSETIPYINRIMKGLDNAG